MKLSKKQQLSAAKLWPDDAVKQDINMLTYSPVFPQSVQLFRPSRSKHSKLEVDPKGDPFIKIVDSVLDYCV